MNYVRSLAHSCSEVLGIPAITGDIIYAQWLHESEGFTSELCHEYHNFAGLTQVEDNGLPQPDGDYFYMKFDSVKDFADYFAFYLSLYKPDGIYRVYSLEDYISCLKNGGYFGDTYENYLNGVRSWLATIR